MNEVNFLPQSFRERTYRRRRRVRQSAAVALLALAMAGWASVQQSALSVQRSEARDLEEQLARALDREERVKRLRVDEQRLGEARRLQRELATPVRHHTILDLLAQLADPSVAFTQIDLINRRPAPAPYVPVGEAGGSAQARAALQAATADTRHADDYIDLHLEALAPDDDAIARLIAALADHPLFGEVKLRSSHLTLTRGVEARRFLVTARVDLRRELIWTDPADAPAAPATPLAEVRDATH